MEWYKTSLINNNHNTNQVEQTKMTGMIHLEYGTREFSHTIDILPKTQALVFTRPSMPKLDGLYIPVPIMPWTMARFRPYGELLEYIQRNKNKPRFRLFYTYDENHGQTMRINLTFWQHSEDSGSQCYITSFVKVSDFHMHGFRLAQRRIRDNPRRLALAMALHPRLGKESPFLLLCGGILAEEILQMIVVLLY